MKRKNVTKFVITLITSFICYTSMAQDLQAALKLTKSDRFEEANEMYAKVIAAQPTNSNAYFYYGENVIKAFLADTIAFTKAEVVEQSSKLFQKGVAVDSTNALNYIGLGMSILLNNGDTTKADVYLNKANSKIEPKVKKCTPKDIEALTKLGLAHVYGKNKRVKKGLSYVERAKQASLNLNPETFIAAGDLYLVVNEGSAAIKNYDKALYLDKNSAISQIKIAYIYLAARNLNESRTFFEQAKQADSTFALVYLGLGEVYSAAGKFDIAKDNYKKFLQLSGDNTPAKVMYASSLFKSNDYDEAIKVIDEVLAVDPSRVFLNRLAAYSYYERKGEKGVSKNPDYEKGMQYIQTFFAKTTPDRIIAKDYAYLGRLQLKMIASDSTNIDKGLSNLLKAFEMDTTEEKIQNEYIKNAYYNKKYPEAIAMIARKNAAGKTTNADNMMLGKTYYQLKDYKKADEVFMGITEKDPKFMEAFIWQANSAISLDPDSKVAPFGLAGPKYDKVIELAMTDTVKYAKDLFDAYNYYAAFYIFTKFDATKAKDYSRKMIALCGTNKDMNITAYTKLAIVQTRTKEYAKAKESYKKILEFDPKNPDVLKAIDGIDKVLKAGQAK